MTSYDDYFPSNFFKADDAVTGPIDLTITDIHPEKMQDGKLKPVVFFKEDRRGLVLNITNKNALVMMTKSKDPVDAVGLKVQLVAVEAEFQGKPCMALRIRPSKPAASSPAPGKRGKSPGKKSVAQDTDDSIP